MVMSVRMRFSELPDFTDKKETFFCPDSVIPTPHPIVGSELSEEILVKSWEIFSSLFLFYDIHYRITSIFYALLRVLQRKLN